MANRKYPKRFIARVKAVFPDYELLHVALEKNSEFVGRILSDSIQGIRPETVLRMIRESKIARLREIAFRAIEIKAIHAEWNKLAPKMFPEG